MRKIPQMPWKTDVAAIVPLGSKCQMRHSPADGMALLSSRDDDEMRGRTMHMRGRSDFQRGAVR
jgi:hypothetical protein